MNSVIKSLMLCFLLSNYAFAAETMHSWGNVYEVGKDSLIVKSRKQVNGELEGNIILKVDSKTTLKGIRSISELKKGDFVIIDYDDSGNSLLKAGVISVPSRLQEQYISQGVSGVSPAQSDLTYRIEKIQAELNSLSEEVTKIKEKLNI